LFCLSGYKRKIFKAELYSYHMARLTDRKTLELIQTLYDRGMPIQAIAEETGVSYATAYRHTRVFERGFASRMAYEEFIMRQNGFSSYNAYQEHLVKKNGFVSRTDYETHLVEKKGFPTLHAYAEHLAVQNNYPSYNAYRENKAHERQQRPLNRMLSSFLQEKLAEIGELTAFMFTDELAYESKLLIWKKLTAEQVKTNLQTIFELLEKIPETEWNKMVIEETILNYIKAQGFKVGDYLWPLRVSLTGREASPGPFEVAEVLGKEESLKRINLAIKKIKN